MPAIPGPLPDSRRILVFGEYGTRNGGENSFLAIAPELMNRGWEFHAAVPLESEFADALRASGIAVHDLALFNVDGQRKTQSGIRIEFANSIGLVKPDLVHCNSLSTSRICGPVTRQLGLPSLGYLRDILKLSKKAVSDINHLDAIIAVSSATRNWHCDQGIDSNKTFVVYNGVDPNQFFPDPLSHQSEADCPVRSQLGIPPDAPLLLFVGQIGIRKGIDTLVDAFLNILESAPKTHLLIVGQRHSQKQEAIEYENQLKNKTGTSKHKTSVHWLGHRSDIPMLMRTATILVHPARQEPLGRVLLEAAASGLPILTTRVGGSTEILRNPEFESLLLEPDDPMELSSRILKMIGDSQWLDDLNSSLRDMANQEFSIERCVQQLDSHYRRLLDE